MKFSLRRKSRDDARHTHSTNDYRKLVRLKLKSMPDDPSLALAKAIGAETMADFVNQGDGHVAVLRHYGLADGMAVYDLGCGCGRTAQALQRAGWQGHYVGADVVPELLAELARQCPAYETKLHVSPTIAAPDEALDMIFHWSVFTHLYPAECYLYMRDAHRALRPGGRMVFSFLELEEPMHDRVWDAAVGWVSRGVRAEQLDQFLHRDWIRRFARDAGFAEPRFVDGSDARDHPPFWQSLAIVDKPA